MPFLLSVVDSTIIQGFSIFRAVQTALQYAGNLGKHSNIILLMWESSVMVEKKFIWTDRHVRPWGNHLPMQCPQCGSLQKWVAGFFDQTYTFECSYSLCGRDVEPIPLSPKVYSFSMPKGAVRLSQGKTSTSSWIMIST